MNSTTTFAARTVHEQRGEQVTHPVVVVGAGPVGMTTSLALARRGVPVILLEAGDAIGVGSRAICIAAHSLEILAQCGVVEAVLDLGLPWTGGRSFYRDRQILEFAMPAPVEGIPPMVNIAQSQLEEILVDAVLAEPLVDLRWQSRVTSLRQDDSAVTLDVTSPLGDHAVTANWVVGTDGPTSGLRDMVGLALHGETHEGRYVIVDLLMRSDRPAERLCWFDPPTFPGKTVLMHKQPRDIWRIDYQVDDDQTLAEATDPAVVLPQVAAHLTWIGETAPWEVEWLTSYRAHSLTLDTYRTGRVLLAGDAAHLVPIFGVRGLNGGMVDASNLAWKLAAVLAGASDSLLDSYTEEQRGAALVNMEAGAASARFMSPAAGPRRSLRDAALALAVTEAPFRGLVDPRQTTPPSYDDSSLSTPDDGLDDWTGDPAPGRLAPEVEIGGIRLAELVGAGHLLLTVGEDAPIELSGLPGLTALRIDDSAHAAAFDGRAGSTYLVRPDRYVAARWRTVDPGRIRTALVRAGWAGGDRDEPQAAVPHPATGTDGRRSWTERRSIDVGA